MIGTSMIAVIGYSLAAFFALASVACVIEVRKSSLRKDNEAANDYRGSFFVGIALSLGSAILTRWLTGGQF